MLLVTEQQPSKSISASINKSVGDTQHKGTTNTSNMIEVQYLVHLSLAARMLLDLS